jgi:hypothetical protein
MDQKTEFFKNKHTKYDYTRIIVNIVDGINRPKTPVDQPTDKTMPGAPEKKREA